jgi:hypothetical protein
MNGPPPPLPNFLIIGTQRGASTYLHKCLLAHPDVFMLPLEEAYFDDPWYDQRCHTDWLRQKFHSAGAATARGFRRAEFLAFPECPGRIARDLPGARLVAVLRHPVDRAISAYHHYVAGGLLPLVPAAEGLPRVLDGSWVDRYPVATHVVGHSHYGEQLDRYLDHVPADDLLVLLDDDLRADRDATLGDVHRFLGVTPQPLPAANGERRSTNGGTRHPLRQRVRRLGNRAIYRPDPTSRVGWTGKDRFWRRAVAAGTTRVDSLVLGRFLPEPPDDVDDGLRARLAELFVDDVAAVESFLGRSIPSWAA